MLMPSSHCFRVLLAGLKRGSNHGEHLESLPSRDLACLDFHHFGLSGVHVGHLLEPPRHNLPDALDLLSLIHSDVTAPQSGSADAPGNPLETCSRNRPS